MHRIWAIIERDLRRFRRSPTLMIVSMIMPLVQLVVLGYAFGGKIKNLKVGVVDQDHGVPAVKLKEMFQAVAANARTFETVAYTDQAAALRDLRNGKINGVLNIPPQFSRDALAGANPRIALDRGQHRPVCRVGPGRNARPTARRLQLEVDPASPDLGTRRCPSSRSIRTCRTSSTCCRARSCWRFSCPP